jgi:hypothetical protein
VGFSGGRRGPFVRSGRASAAAAAAVARRFTPLDWAIIHGDAAITAALLAAGEFVTAASRGGYERGRSWMTAEQQSYYAQGRGQSGAYALAVEQARGRSFRHRLPPRPPTGCTHFRARTRQQAIAHRDCTVGLAL